MAGQINDVVKLASHNLSPVDNPLPQLPDSELEPES